MYFQIPQRRRLNGQGNDPLVGSLGGEMVEKLIFRTAAHDVELVVLLSSVSLQLCNCLLYTSPSSGLISILNSIAHHFSEINACFPAASCGQLRQNAKYAIMLTDTIFRETIGSGSSATIMDFIYDNQGLPFALNYSTQAPAPRQKSTLCATVGTTTTPRQGSITLSLIHI